MMRRVTLAVLALSKRQTTRHDTRGDERAAADETMDADGVSFGCG